MPWVSMRLLTLWYHHSAAAGLVKSTRPGMEPLGFHQFAAAVPASSRTRYLQYYSFIARNGEKRESFT